MADALQSRFGNWFIVNISDNWEQRKLLIIFIPKDFFSKLRCSRDG